MQSVSFDLRDGLRSFRHDRAYAVTIIFTLALTIGATTAVFSIVNVRDMSVRCRSGLAIDPARALRED